MVQDIFDIVVNNELKRYEFTPKVDGFCSYTVSFDEVDTVEDACIAVYLALQKNYPELFIGEAKGL